MTSFIFPLAGSMAQPMGFVAFFFAWGGGGGCGAGSGCR